MFILISDLVGVPACVMLWASIPAIVGNFSWRSKRVSYPQSGNSLYRGFPQPTVLSLDDLIENMQFMIELGIGLAVLGNLAHCVQHRRVIASAE